MTPDHPYGGMENPHLITIDQKAVTGDKSVEELIAHEIVHQWFGNIVTYVNMEHLWINEGFTSFLTKKVMGRLYGEPFRHFLGIRGWRSLDHIINEKKNPLSRLVNNDTLEGKLNNFVA